jgi:multidrug transporter EmrE-like cation transporter
MQVESTALLLVIVSGFVHAVWNLFTKQSTSKPHFLLLCQVVSVSLYLPVAIVWFWPHTIPTAGWGLILISTLIHGAYIWLLSRVYTIGDLSKAYPIVRGTAPLLVPIIAVLALGESLSIYGWIAVVCIVAGILTLADLRSGVTQLHRDHVLMTSLAIDSVSRDTRSSTKSCCTIRQRSQRTASRISVTWLRCRITCVTKSLCARSGN